jgi:hypothetical protein
MAWLFGSGWCGGCDGCWHANSGRRWCGRNRAGCWRGCGTRNSSGNSARDGSRNCARRSTRSGCAGGHRRPVQHAAAQITFHTAAGAQVGQHQGANEKGRGAGRCHARQKVSAATGTKQTARSTTAKRGTHVSTLAVLNEHQANHRQGGQQLHGQDYGHPNLHVQSSKILCIRATAV